MSSTKHHAASDDVGVHRARRQHRRAGDWRALAAGVPMSAAPATTDSPLSLRAEPAVAHVVKHLRPLINARSEYRGTCVATTCLAVRYLRGLGIRANPALVRLRICNPLMSQAVLRAKADPAHADELRRLGPADGSDCITYPGPTPIGGPRDGYWAGATWSASSRAACFWTYPSTSSNLRHGGTMESSSVRWRLPRIRDTSGLSACHASRCSMTTVSSGTSPSRPERPVPVTAGGARRRPVLAACSTNSERWNRRGCDRCRARPGTTPVLAGADERPSGAARQRQHALPGGLMRG